MSKITAIIIILLIILCPYTALAADTEVSSNDLIDDAKQFDMLEVIYTGEIIGDIMQRGDHTWINVSDGSNAIGIWVENKDTEGISLAGRYNIHGDTVRITGIFNRACAEHGGDFDIHASDIEIIEKGHTVTYLSSNMKEAVAYILCAVSIILVLRVFIRKRKKDISVQ